MSRSRSSSKKTRIYPDLPDGSSDQGENISNDEGSDLDLRLSGEESCSTPEQSFINPTPPKNMYPNLEEDARKSRSPHHSPVRSNERSYTRRPLHDSTQKYSATKPYEMSPYKNLESMKLIDKDDNWKGNTMKSDSHQQMPKSSINNTNEDDANLNYIWAILLAFIAIITGYLTHNYYSTPPRHMFHKAMPDSFPIFKSLLTKFKSEEFSSQPAHSWTVIRSALRPTLSQLQPERPGIILLAGVDFITPYCFSRAIAKSGMKALGYETSDRFIEIQSWKYVSLPASNVMLEVDNILNGLQSFPVSIIHEFDKLPGDSSMLLFGYADDQNAKFKEAIILVTVNLDQVAQKELEKPGSNCDAVVTSYLTRVWTNINKLNPDKIDPFLARIAVNIICLVEEKDLVKNQC